MMFSFFCYYNGLAFADVEKLKPPEIGIGIDRSKWIFTNRQKTDTVSMIPLPPLAIDILEKYKDHPAIVNSNKVLPVISNQKYNEYLKEIAGICSINKKMTSHTVIHTFATTITLSNGVPMESVSKMLKPSLFRGRLQGLRHNIEKLFINLIPDFFFGIDILFYFQHASILFHNSL